MRIAPSPYANPWHKGGMTNLTFDNAFYDSLIKAAQPVYDEIGKKVGKEIVDSLVNALKTGK